MDAMKAVRALVTGFVLLVIGVAVTGWFWTGAHQPGPQSTASRIVLALSVVAGLLGLRAVWRHRSDERDGGRLHHPPR
jgi:hypothetical protein